MGQGQQGKGGQQGKEGQQGGKPRGERPEGEGQKPAAE